MKVLARTLVILFAALLVVGVAAIFAQSSFAASLVPAGGPDAVPVFAASTTAEAGAAGTDTAAVETAAAKIAAAGTTGSPASSATSTAAPTMPVRGGHGEEGHPGAISAAADIAKNLGSMALIVGIVAGPQAMVKRLRPRRSGRSPSSKRPGQEAEKSAGRTPR